MARSSTAASRRRVRVSAPGKAILVGEHAAVHGHPAVVAALPVRVEVTASLQEDANGTGLVIGLDGAPQRHFATADVQRLREAAAASWERFASGVSPFRPLERVAGELDGLMLRNPAVEAFVLAAAGEALRWLEGRGGHLLDRCLLHLDLRSDIPLGAGCGSSAAVACSVSAAVLAVHGVGVSAGCTAVDAVGEGSVASWNDLQELAQEIERRQHGRPSGVDVATVLLGGVLLVRPVEGGSLEFCPLEVGDRLRSLRSVLTGRRPESTGEVVARVQQELGSGGRSRVVSDALERLGLLAGELAEQLGTNDGSEPQDLSALLSRAEEDLEQLGVVPGPVIRWLARLRGAGVGGKISGAGSLLGPGAGLVLLMDPEGRASEAIAEAAYQDLGFGLGNEGLRLERLDD